MCKLIVALFCLLPFAAVGEEAVKPPSPAQKPAAATPEAKSEEKAPAEPEEEASSDYEVVDAKLGTGITDRELEGVAASFKADVGKVYCWTKVTGPEDGGEITHAWYKGDEKMSEVKLALKFKSVRTWSYKTIPADGQGEWHVDVLAPDGTVLKSIVFKIE